MGLYLFENPQTGEVKEIFQNMLDDHSYSENGVKWQRLFTSPQAAFSTQIDPFDSKAFLNKTGQKNDTVGSILDRSKDLSEKRKDKLGIDPLKEQYYQDYSAKRSGKKHHDVIKRESNKRLKKMGVEIE